MQENTFEDDFLDDTLLKFILMVKYKGSALVIILYLVMLWACEFYEQEGRIWFGGEGQNRSIVLMGGDEI